MIKVALDLHDFSVVHNRLDLLLKFKEYYPNFKVSLFTIPVDEMSDWGPFLVRKGLLQEVKKHLDWIQIIPHGFRHNGSEMADMNYNTFRYSVMPAIEACFGTDGLPYINGFCSPHWRWTGGVVKALDDEGWWGAVDRDKVMPYTKKFYRYNYLLNEPFWDGEEEVLKLHGHVYGTKNDMGRCFTNLTKLPVNTEWHFVTDFLEENK